MWGFLVASRCIFIQIMTLLDHRNTATTKKLDFKNSYLTSVGATSKLGPHTQTDRGTVTKKTAVFPGSTNRGPLALDQTELPVLPWPAAAVGLPPPLAS
jgi:hypothetical protein